MWVKLKVLSFILSQLLISIGLVEAISKCYDTGKFTTNSTYGRNRDLILASLPRNVSTNGNFFNTTIGENSDKVYALGMCKGDATPDECYRCLKSNIRSLIAICPSQKEALSFVRDPCHVHYADHLFFGNLEPGDPELVVDANKITFDLTKFETIWASLLDVVVSKASKGSSKLKYATGEAVLSENERMYLLMQCTPDLSHTACSSCLWQTGNYYENCCRGYQGGSLMKHNCYFRWQLYPFYVDNASTSATPRLPAPSPPLPSVNTPLTKDGKKHNKSNWIPLGASLSVTLGVVLFSACGIFLWKRRNIQRDKKDSQEVQLLDIVNGRVTHENTSANFHLGNEGGSQEFPSIQLDILQAATNDFCDENKLGQGGFGPVYKGTLADGNDIAVKRLSKTSGQGQLEFKNEVMLIAKLQHRNLVRLLGCCLENNETLLVYEFMHNRSLDVFIFDSSLGKQLAWPKRFSIIKGTSRGIMYLHEDSRLRIIHRDLKASNVLLDLEMNPKISDFGMAKVFGVDQNEANTNRVVGTYGYMAPEYAMEGLFSVKSDVFSFGVLLLEIISGKRNNGFHLSEHGESLLTFAWKLWWRGEGMKLIDENLVESSSRIEVLKCINIGLLCVQADPADRPTMSSVVAMLENDTIMLPLPGKPAFYVGRFVLEPKQTNSSDKICSVNGVTISNMSPR